MNAMTQEILKNTDTSKSSDISKQARQIILTIILKTNYINYLIAASQSVIVLTTNIYYSSLAKVIMFLSLCVY